MPDLTVLQTIWFVAIVVLWGLYFVLQGFDFGVGMLMRRVRRDHDDRRVALHAIGPTWAANEVWAVIAVVAMFGAFPGWYGAWASALYVPLTLILLSLIARNLAIELIGKRSDARWRLGWERVLVAASTLAPFLWGMAWSAVVWGIAMRASATGPEVTAGPLDVLSPYAIAGGLAYVLLARAAGAAFLSLRTADDVHAAATRQLRLDRPARRGRRRRLPRLDPRRRPRLAGRRRLDRRRRLLRRARGVGVGRDGAEHLSHSPRACAAVALLLASWFALLFPAGIAGADGGPALALADVAAGSYSLWLMTGVTVLLLPLVGGLQAWSYWLFRHRISRADVGAPPPSPVELVARLAGGRGDDAAVLHGVERPGLPTADASAIPRGPGFRRRRPSYPPPPGLRSPPPLPPPPREMPTPPTPEPSTGSCWRSCRGRGCCSAAPSRPVWPGRRCWSSSRWRWRAAVAGAAFDGRDLAALRPTLLVLAAAVAGRALLAAAGDWLGRRAAERAMAELRHRVAAELLAARPRRVEQARRGELATAAVHGVDALADYYATAVPQIALAAAVPPALVGVVLWHDPLVGVLLGLTLPLVVVFMVLVGRESAARIAERRQALGVLGAHFLDVVRGLPTLRAHGRAEAQAATLERDRRALPAGVGRGAAGRLPVGAGARAAGDGRHRDRRRGRRRPAGRRRARLRGRAGRAAARARGLRPAAPRRPALPRGRGRRARRAGAAGADVRPRRAPRRRALVTEARPGARRRRCCARCRCCARLPMLRARRAAAASCARRRCCARGPACPPRARRADAARRAGRGRERTSGRAGRLRRDLRRGPSGTRSSALPAPASRRCCG